MRPKRGDIVLLLFPNSNLRTAKRRPGLVVQADGLNTQFGQSVVAMISSNLARGEHPSRVSVEVATPDGRQSGLRLDSVVMTDNLATVLHTEIDRVVGSMPDMAGIDQALRHTLAL